MRKCIIREWGNLARATAAVETPGRLGVDLEDMFVNMPLTIKTEIHTVDVKG